MSEKKKKKNKNISRDFNKKRKMEKGKGIPRLRKVTEII